MGQEASHQNVPAARWFTLSKAACFRADSEEMLELSGTAEVMRDEYGEDVSPHLAAHILRAGNPQH